MPPIPYRSTFLGFGLALGLALLPMACASPQGASSLQQKLAKRGYALGEQVVDLQQYQLNGWRYLDDRHLIIETGPSQHYLLTLRTSCHELSTMEDLGLSSTAGRLTRFDSVVFRRGDGFHHDCPIDTIHRLERTTPRTRS